jgi:hypothetical protein
MRSLRVFVVVLVLVGCLVSFTRAQNLTECFQDGYRNITTADIVSMANTLIQNFSAVELQPDMSLTFNYSTAKLCSTNFDLKSAAGLTINVIGEAALQVVQDCCPNTTCKGGGYAYYGNYNNTPAATVLLGIFEPTYNCSNNPI